MNPQGQSDAGGTLQGRRVSARGRLAKGLRAAVSACCLALLACPQLLEDEFQELPPELLSGAGGASPGVGSGGAAAGQGGDAAGGAGSGGGSGGSGGSTAGSGSAGSAAVPVTPVLVSSVPADGALGVAADTDIVLTFSAPMDTASVQAAYSSSSLPASQVSFSWSDGDTVLRIVPSAALEMASGSDPSVVVARQYALDITAQARDKAGNALAPVHVSFSVVRSLTQLLGVVMDRDLTGNWRTDGTYGLAYCERNDTTFCAGDTPALGNIGYRGFLTFDLAALPAELIALSAVELSATVALRFGTPFTDMGALRVEHVSFDTIGDEAFSAAGLASPRTLAESADVDSRLALDVSSEVQADRAARGRSQFRLAFEVDSDADAVSDLLVFDWSSAALTVTYLVP